MYESTYFLVLSCSTQGFIILIFINLISGNSYFPYRFHLLFFFLLLKNYPFDFWLHWVLLAVGGLSLVAEWGLLFVVVQASHCDGCPCRRAQAREPAVFGSCGQWAPLLCGMWDLSGPGIEPMSLALAGKFLSAVHQGSPNLLFFYYRWFWTSEV